MNKIYKFVSTFLFGLFSPAILFASGKDLISEIDSRSNTEDVNIIVSELETLPTGIIEILEKNNITVRIIDKTEEFERLSDGDSFIAAKAISPSYYIYTPGNKIEIYRYGYIECYTSDNISYSYGSTMHEIGHELDYLKAIETGYHNGFYLGYSETREWEKLYNENQKKLSDIDDLSKINVPYGKEEGFAEAFRIGLINKSVLKRECPEIYKYISSIYGAKILKKENFDYLSYANRYEDLKKAFGYNKELLYKHYIEHGVYEGRVANILNNCQN